MSAGYETTQRFLRPTDVGRTRRNQRRIQIQRIFSIACNVLAVLTVLTVAAWLYRRAQSDERFAVKTIEISGAAHTPRAAIDAITRTYVGLNLFKIDIARVQHDLGGLAWVQRIEIEKKLPDTLHIKIVERTPVAVVQHDARLDYVDEQGVVFAELSPSVGDSDLPMITDADGAELARAVRFIRDLHANDAPLFARVSEVRPVAPNGFAVFDRALGAFVYLNSGDALPKWRSLYAIAAAEHLGRAQIAYADLRFADRIIVKPVHPLAAGAPVTHLAAAAQITN